MRVLLDTCVLSELRRSDGNPQVSAAVSAIPDQDLLLSVLTIGEIVKGITILDPGKKKRALLAWVSGLQESYADRILSVDAETCAIWGEITAHAQARGIVVPAIDGLIAATARRFGLHVMTRNTADFAATGVLTVNPWESPY